MAMKSYVFTPPKKQVANVERAIRVLRKQGMKDLTLDQFYEYAAERMLQEYKRGEFVYNYRFFHGKEEPDF